MTIQLIIRLTHRESVTLIIELVHDLRMSTKSKGIFLRNHGNPKTFSVANQRNVIIFKVKHVGTPLVRGATNPYCHPTLTTALLYHPLLPIGSYQDGPFLQLERSVRAASVAREDTRRHQQV
jgi:hypothetical protein